MPWSVGKSSKCPASKPWAVTKDSDGTVEGCHATKAAATKQQAALYASEPGRSGGHMTTAVERRFTAVPVEVRNRGEQSRIGGYAAKFMTYSRNLGGFVEQIAPPFFNKSRGDGWPEVIARFNHDDNMLLGTIAGGTLSLSIDETGLVYDVLPPNSMRHVVEWIERGDVRKSSFAFRTIEDDWGMTPDGGPLRTLVSGNLVDVAPVTLPAYTDTTAGLRSLADKFEADFEEVRSMAKAGELRKFFVRTDDRGPKPKAPLSGAAALAHVQDLIEVDL